MKKINKQAIANIIMVCVIVIIFAGGILCVGALRGWFDKDDRTGAAIQQLRGICSMTRDGVAYTPQEGMLLRTGDKLSTGHSATLQISAGDGYLVLNQSGEITIQDPQNDTFTIDVACGELFFSAPKATPYTVNFAEKQTVLQDSASLMSVLKGSSSLNVLSGSVTCEKTAQAGETLSWVGKDCSVFHLTIDSMNDFSIAQIRAANKIRSGNNLSELYFANQDLDKLEQDRLAAMEEMLNQETHPTVLPADEAETTVPDETGTTDSPRPEDSDNPASDDTGVSHSGETEVSDPVGSQNPQPTKPQKPDSGDPEKPKPAKPQKPDSGDPEKPKPAEPQKPEQEDSKETKPAQKPEPTQSAPTEPPATEPPARNLHCAISIRCDTILDNWENLDPEKEGYVPADGTILPTMTVSFSEGETVFDILTRVCKTMGIPIEYSYTPMYGSHYIEGIHNLYEFDCGQQSGWMYQVNGWYPNYGCSKYVLKDGDVISWNYTCNGLGADLGAPPMA